MNHDSLKLLAGNKPKKKRKSKYGNKQITVDGVLYHSEGEYRRECELKVQQRAGIIKNLKRQVEFSFDINDVHVCKYIADWTYNICDDGTFVVEDWKGFETQEFKIKKKLMIACHGLSIWTNKKVNAHCALEYPF